MDPGDGRGDDRLLSKIRDNFWFSADDIGERRTRIAPSAPWRRGCAVTPPIKNRFEVDIVNSRDQVNKQMSSADANNLAAERVICLLNEIVAKGVLPAL
jgi:hypothetical protein